jgi:predicted nucleic acid-binding Zn ribbon protein
MKAPIERKLYPKGYYECSLCGHGVEIHVRMTEKPMCTKHGVMQLSKKPLDIISENIEHQIDWDNYRNGDK